MHPVLRPRTAAHRLSAAGALALAAALVVGSSAPPPATAVELLPTTTTLAASPDTLQEHHPVTLTATVDAVDATGSVTFAEVVSAVPTDIGSVDVVAGVAALELPTLPVGSHTFRATYGGDATYAGSVGDVVVTVTADIVEAAGVGISPARFYPKVDGYKDTLKIKGTRLEPLSVSIVIKNSAGKKVRTKSIARAAGAYAWSWNGKNAAGRLQPAGKYTVIQKLSDGYTTKVFKNTVALSWKKLDWRSFTTSKTLRQAATGGQGWAGWNFTVPSATVYGKLIVSAYAKGHGAVGAREVACGGAAWNLGCYYGREFSGGWAWYSTSLPGKKFVSSAERVRVVVLNLGGKFGFERVRITLKYAVLR